MTQSNPGGATPPSVAGPATVQADLPSQKPFVLGIFGPEQNLAALIRLPNGRTKTFHRGDRLNGRQIVRIDTDGVVVASGGREDRLALP